MKAKTQKASKSGYGPTFPLFFRGNDFVCGTGFALAASSARIILGADGASRDGLMRGEFRGHQRLGTHIRRYLDRNLRSAKNVMTVVGVEALTEFEPRLEVDPANTSVSQRDRSVNIRVRSSISEEVSGEATSGSVIEAEWTNG